jgi:choline dehydrogenase-like flavoprotein
MPDPSRYFDAFRLLMNLEQQPDPENRITLSAERDALGVPRARLHWSWGAHAQTTLDTVRSIVISELESAALGKVELIGSRTPDPNAHHHAGTTRMARDPHFGVVDSDSLVHGVDNLYVAGASVFPTAGYANPTLTIVALATRLADHLHSAC